jgi:hypothetical protein
MGVIQTTPEKAGDTYSYVSRTRESVVRNQTTSEIAYDQAFTIVVETVSSHGMTLRFTQTADTEGQSDASGPTLLRKAWTGVPVEFETAANGDPLRVINADEVKTKLVANVIAMTSSDPPSPANLRSQLDGVPPDAFAKQVAGEKLTTLSAMQPRGLVRYGLNTLPDEIHADADGGKVTVHETIAIGFAEDAPCRVKITRKTWTERPGGPGAPSSSLETEAVIPENDGWAASLTEVQRNSNPNGTFTSTVTLSRVQPADCPH